MILTAEVALSSCHVLLSKTNVIVCGSGAIDRLCGIYIWIQKHSLQKNIHKENYIM
jgi:hypothetical protein